MYIPIIIHNSILFKCACTCAFFVQPEQDAVNMIYAACIRDKVGSYCAKDYHDYKTEIGGNHYDVYIRTIIE